MVMVINPTSTYYLLFITNHITWWCCGTCINQ